MIDLQNTVEDVKKASEFVSLESPKESRLQKEHLPQENPLSASSSRSPRLTRHNSRTSNAEKEEEEEAKETPYRLHPL